MEFGLREKGNRLIIYERGAHLILSFFAFEGTFRFYVLCYGIFVKGAFSCLHPDIIKSLMCASGISDSRMSRQGQKLLMLCTEEVEEEQEVLNYSSGTAKIMSITDL